MKTYMVGRNPDERRSRIIISGNKTISSTHCTLTELGEGRFRLEDQASTNGTFIKDISGWRRIATADISQDTAIRLGDHRTTAIELMNAAVEEKERLVISRNPHTGEIEQKFE